MYIITGLKTVTGAKAKSYKSRAVGGNLGVEVDGTVWSGGGVPVSVGPVAEGNMERKDGVSWEGSSDFVFAFRVRKVFVEKPGKLRSDEDYKSGAMFERERATNVDPQLSILAVEDPDAEQEGFVKELLTEDNFIVHCAAPYVVKSVEDEE